jgi:hypothetical protein
MLQKKLLITILMVFFFSICQPVEASSLQPLDKIEIQELLKQAHEAQYSLAEKYYSWEEALSRLTPYMKNEFATKFMEEHLFLEEGGYIFYGSDFSIYFIPHFSFDEKTNVVVNLEQQKMYIFEKFTGTGPVTFKDQYELVTLEAEGSNWKISNISFLNELPEEVKAGKSLEDTSVEHLSLSTVDHEMIGGVEPLVSSHIKNEFHLNEYSVFIGTVPYFLIFKYSDDPLSIPENNQQNVITFLTMSSIVWK